MGTLNEGSILSPQLHSPEIGREKASGFVWNPSSSLEVRTASLKSWSLSAACSQAGARRVLMQRDPR